MKNATVHIVDDDQAVRSSLKLLIGSAGVNSHEYESGRDFLDRYAPCKPECLLLDLRMPGMDGLELLRELHRRDIDIATVFLSGHGDIPIAVRAVREGALEFVEKPFNKDDLLRRIQSGIATDAEREQTRVDREDAEQRLARLTAREREVVDLLVAGNVNKVIAHEMGISMRTVEFHRSRAMKKLGVASLPEIFKLVLLTKPENDISEP